MFTNGRLLPAKQVTAQHIKGARSVKERCLQTWSVRTNRKNVEQLSLALGPSLAGNVTDGLEGYPDSGF